MSLTPEGRLLPPLGPTPTGREEFRNPCPWTLWLLPTAPGFTQGIAAEDDGIMPPRKFPVTVTQMATLTCQVCRRVLNHGPQLRASEVLTAHYRQHHPELLASGEHPGDPARAEGTS